MTRRIRAAVLERPGAGLTVEELELADPARDEVLVRIDAAGVCHSDYHYLTGDLPSRMPVVPGHEGAGEVVAVGSEVTAARPGDMVGLMWRPRCGRCRYCLAGRPALCQSGAIHAASGGLQDGTTRLGATHVVDAGSQDVAAMLSDLDADGFDYAVEAIGRPGTLRQGGERPDRRRGRPRHHFPILTPV